MGKWAVRILLKCFLVSYEIKINTSILNTMPFQKSHILPDFDDEFYMMVHDWMRDSSFEILTKVRYEMIRYIAHC